MSLILSIDEKQLDLSPETIIAYTFQANNIGQLQNPNSNYSNIFKVPFTAKNHIAFENARNINSTTNIPYQNISGSLSNNGLNIVTNGIATLEDVSGSYNLRLNSGNIDFFSLLGESVVSRLYDGGIYGEIHQWNLTNIFESRANTEGYIYPFIDWNNESSVFFGNVLNVQSMLPCLFIKSIFDRIELATDFNIQGTFIESERYPNLLLTPDTFTYTDEIRETIKNGFEISQTDLPEPGTVPASPSPPYAIINYPSYSQIFSIEFNDGISDFQSSFLGVWNIDYDLNLFIEDSGALSPRAVYLSLYDSTTSTIVASQIIASSTGGEINGDYSGQIIFTNEYTANHDYKIQLLFAITEDSIPLDFQVNSINYLKMNFTPNPLVTFGGVVFLNQMFQIKQKDLIFDLMNQHALVCQTNNISKTIEFNYFDDLISNLHLAKDWSNKVDPNSLTLNFSFGDYAKKNNFKYKENETVTAGFGDSYFNIADENLKEEATAVQLFTSATETLLEDTLVFPNIKSFEYDPLVSGFTGRNNRILILNSTESVDPIEWNDFNGNTDSSTTLPLCEFEPLSFENLIPENYETLQRILDKTKGITLMIKINELDLNELDFLIPIYLHVQCREVFLTGNFYLNKIEQYTGGKYTKCELFGI